MTDTNTVQSQPLAEVVREQREQSRAEEGKDKPLTNAERLAQSQQQQEQSGQVVEGKTTQELDNPGQENKNLLDANPDKTAPDPENLAQTGNPVIDGGIRMLQDIAGLKAADVERILHHAQEHGDASLIDTAFIKERFPKHAEYVEQLAKAYMAETQTRITDTVNKVYEAVGGEAQWKVLQQTFSDNAPKHLQAAARALADSEDFLGVAALVKDFVEAGGFTPVTGDHLKGGGAVAQGALSARAFSEELSKLRKAAGNRSLESGALKVQYDSLIARRAQGRRQNI